MRLPDREDTRAEVDCAVKLSEELEAIAVDIEDGGTNYRERRAIEESGDPIRARFRIKIDGILVDLACEADGSDGDYHSAVESATDEVMKMFDKLRVPYPPPPPPTAPAKAERAGRKRA